MKTKTLTLISFILNILFIGYILFTSIRNNQGQLAQEEVVNFDDEFINEVTSQNLVAQSLLYQTPANFQQDSMGYKMDNFQNYIINIQRGSKDCQPIKDKRKFKIELGELIITFKKEQPVSIKGLNITRESVDSLLADIFVYDKAICNICKALSQIGKPTTPEERKYILDLMDKQQKIVESYTVFKTNLSKSKTEDEIKKAIEENKPNIEEVKKEAA